MCLFDLNLEVSSNLCILLVMYLPTSDFCGISEILKASIDLGFCTAIVKDGNVRVQRIRINT